MVGHSITRAPRFSRRERRSADCDAARVMRMVLPLSSAFGNFGKDFSGSHREHALAEFDSKLLSPVWLAGAFTCDDTFSVETCDQSFDRELVPRDEHRMACNRNLAASPECTQESPFGCHG